MIKYNPKIKRFFNDVTKRFVKTSNALKSSEVRKHWKRGVKDPSKIVRVRIKKIVEEFPEYVPETIPEGYESLPIDASGERRILEHENLNLKTKEQSTKSYFDSFMDTWSEAVDFESEDDY